MIDQTKPVLELKDINKTFESVKALEDVNLKLDKGEVIGLVGDNGAGKSTLMKITSGALQPDSGVRYIEGEKVNFSSPKEAKEKHVEMVYQDISLCDSLDVAQNLFMGREPTKRVLGLNFLDHKTIHQRAEKYLQSLQIDIPSTHTKVEFLSGGQRQSIAIARAISFSPRVLILDEPTTGLAVKEGKEVISLVQRLKEEGVGIIFISHRLQDVLKASDRIVVLFRGRKIAEREAKNLDLAEVVNLIVNEE